MAKAVLLRQAKFSHGAPFTFNYEDAVIAEATRAALRGADPAAALSFCEVDFAIWKP